MKDRPASRGGRFQATRFHDRCKFKNEIFARRAQEGGKGGVNHISDNPTQSQLPLVILFKNWPFFFFFLI